MNERVIVYGCYGYTGKLIVAELLKLGIKPILSGRNSEKVEAIAKEFNLEFKVSSLNTNHLDALLKNAKVMAHCAGPFIHTAKPMMEACIRNGVNYLDITGEIDVFKMGYAMDNSAQNAGVTLLPGAGFDIVPSDCLASHLYSRLPDATHLEMAFFSKGRASRGTSLTVVEGMGKGGMIRENGKMKPVPEAFDVKEFQFGPNKLNAVTIPWGDVFTAFISTGIPNVRVYMGMPDKVIKSLKMSRWFGPILRMEWIKNRMRKKIKAGKPGPSERSLNNDDMFLIGTATNAKGNLVTTELRTPSGYKLTASTAAEIAKRLLSEKVNIGFQTPSLAFGKDFITEFDDVKRTDT